MKRFSCDRHSSSCDSDECFRKTDASSIDLNVEGGKLVVSFPKKRTIPVFLKGPAEFVFKGTFFENN
jgi:diaminopimelate epimerase